MKKDKEVDPEDRDLFREHMRDVQRHKHDRVVHKTAQTLTGPAPDPCR